MLTTKNFILLIIIFLFLGCSNIRTRDAYRESLLTNVKNRNFPGAVKIIEDTKDKSFADKDRVLYHLYSGVLLHYNQEYAESNIHLTQAEDAIEELYTKSISKATASMLLNDNAFAYAGEDYEDIYINIFKALNYINLNKPESAFVEIRKVNIKLNLLEDKYKKYADELNKSDDSKIKIKVTNNKFNNSALARYLSMLLFRAEEQFDDARIDQGYIEEAFNLQANIYNFSQPDLSGFTTVKSDSAKLDLISFTGLAPEKHPITYRIATLENMITVFADNGQDVDGQQFLFPGVEAGYYFKFSIPQMREKQSNITKITIDANGKVIGQLAKIEDINRIAKETFQIKANMTYIRAITRTVLKGIASILTQQEVEKRTGEFGGFLAKLGTAALTEASEAADLRSCIIFPGFAYVGDFDVTPGIYNINVNYYNNHGVIEYSEQINQYEIKLNEINLIESYYFK